MCVSVCVHICQRLTNNIQPVSSVCLFTGGKLIRGLGFAPLIIAHMIYTVTHMFTLHKCTFPSTTSHRTHKLINYGGIYEAMF